MYVFADFQLEHKLVSVPEKRQQNETILDQEKRKLSVVDELAPLNANVSLKIPATSLT